VAEGTFIGGAPSLLKAINERTVLDAIRGLGPVSRAQIARTCRLSKPTVSQALAALLRSKLVREAGRSSSGKGRSAQLYELNPHAAWVLGIDVGHDWVRAALADLSGTIVARQDERSQLRSASALIGQIVEVAHGLAGAAGVRWRSVSQATIGSPGVFEPGRRKMTFAESLPGWERQGVVETLIRSLDTQVSIENDVNVATVGEQLHGLGKGVDNFVFLHVGTGVGMGLVVEGHLVRGASGAAGEVGYLPFRAAPAPTPDGEEDGRATGRRRATLDASVGATGVVAEARRLGMRGPVTAKRVFTAARAGDEVAREVVLAEARRIAFTIASTVPVLDPELVVLGGGIGRNGDLLLDPVERALTRLSPFRPRVEVSALGEDGPVLGAVAMALRSAQERLFARGGERTTMVV
jgi:predicted NBD/HSP70 family sugar kinase